MVLIEFLLVDSAESQESHDQPSSHELPQHSALWVCPLKRRADTQPACKRPQHMGIEGDRNRSRRTRDRTPTGKAKAQEIKCWHGRGAPGTFASDAWPFGGKFWQFLMKETIYLLYEAPIPLLGISSQGKIWPQKDS